MEDRETARMRKYWESKTTRIMMATVPHVTSGLGLRKFQADGFLLTRVYNHSLLYSGSGTGQLLGSRFSHDTVRAVLQHLYAFSHFFNTNAWTVSVSHREPRFD